MPLTQIPPPDQPVMFVYKGSEQLGPMTRRELYGRVQTGEIADSEHFWYQGMAGWERLADHGDLFQDVIAPAPAAAPPADAAMAPTMMAHDLASQAAPPGAQATPAPAQQAAQQAAPVAQQALPEVSASEDDRLDAIFGEIVRKSWDLVTERELAQHIDEVFLGSVITASLDDGYSLIDLNSDGTHHYLRFENMADGSRLIVRLRHLTGDLVTAKVLGQQASAVIGYGEKAKNMSSVMSALKAEFKSGFIQNPEPGTITVDGDLKSGYVYAQVDLLLDIGDYVSDDYSTNTTRLCEHIDATTHVLRKYLRGRFN